MNLKQIVRISAAIAALSIPTGLARAQQAQGTGPIGPIGPIQGRQIPVPAGRVLDAGPDRFQMQADTHTLASIESLGIGSLGALTSFLDPSFRFTQSGDKGMTPNWNGMSSLGMNLAFDRNRSRSRLTGVYNGAQVVYYPDSTANAAYHNLVVTDELHLGRSVFRLREDLMSSPEASLGGIDIGGLILSGGNAVANILQPAAGTGDTILTQRAKRLRSTTSGEVNYYLSRRSILTTTGSYALLTFPNGGYVDSHRIAGRVGYDYLLSPKNMIGLMYDYSRTDFNGVAPRLRTDSLQLAFGHRVTGRLAFQMAGGPQRITLGTGNQQTTWTVSNNINFQTRRTQYFFSYTHSSSSGSGVLPGASNHTARAGIRHALSQRWSASTSAGYSFDRALAQTTGVVNRFGSWFGTANVERAIGRHVHFSLNYGFQQQNAGAGACPVTGCGPTALHQVVGMTLEWHPFAIEAR